MENEENVDITTEDVVVTDNAENQAVVTDTAEKVTTEEVQSEKTFTQSQVDKMMADRAQRAERAAERKYSKLVNIMQKATGAKDLNELEHTVSDFYQSQGVDLSTPSYDDREEEILANAEAKQIIDLGYDDIKSETDRLMAIGNDNLSLREKYLYKALATEQKRIEEVNTLKSIGVSEDVIDSKEFNEFKSKFKDNTSINDVYSLYSKLQPKEEVNPIGSMKTESSKDEIKNYYSPEDFDKLTDEQLNNPKIWEAVMKSKAEWNKR
jgi:PHD/YefM family antitoxin component YafN of YafNO toxin-antitoxin module